jgi:uncharacterized protein (TIGR03067 family)
MYRLALTGLVLVLWAPAGPSQSDEAAKELAKLRGTWNLESRSSGGSEVKAVRVFRFQLQIEGDRWTTLVKGKEAGTHKFVIDPTKSPKTLDQIVGKAVIRGIYKLEANTLTVAVAPAGQARPESFESVKGSSTILSVYKRQKQ